MDTKFVERAEGESLVDHLMRNSAAVDLTASDRAILRHAQRLQTGTRREREEANRLGQEVAGTLDRQLDQAIAIELRNGGDVVGDVAWQGRRGGVVGRAEPMEDGCARPVAVVRLQSRDGLKSLHDRGKITARQLAAALAYRSLWETLAADLQSQLGAIQGTGGVRSNDDRIAAKFERTRDAIRLGEIERRVVAESRARMFDSKIALELLALRQVAGDGRSAASVWGNGGKQIDITVAALVRALAIVAAELSMPVDPAEPNEAG